MKIWTNVECCTLHNVHWKLLLHHWSTKSQKCCSESFWCRCMCEGSNISLTVILISFTPLKQQFPEFASLTQTSSCDQYQQLIEPKWRGNFSRVTGSNQTMQIIVQDLHDTKIDLFYRLQCTWHGQKYLYKWNHCCDRWSKEIATVVYALVIWACLYKRCKFRNLLLWRCKYKWWKRWKGD